MERRHTRKRAESRSLWVNQPLQNEIRAELERRDWTISDLAREIRSQPSLVSRWMMGQRPNTESVRLVAEALGLDERRLLVLAGHMSARDGELDEDPRSLALIAKLRQVEMTDERHAVLAAILDVLSESGP